MNNDQPVSYIDQAALIHDIEYLKTANRAKADLNMFANLFRAQPLSPPMINAFIYAALVLSSPFYNPEPNDIVYEAAKRYVKANYNLTARFADDIDGAS